MNKNIKLIINYLLGPLLFIILSWSLYKQIIHQPDLALRWRWVHIELSTHSAGGVTEMDVTLARTIDEVAAGLPLAAKS